MYHSHQVNHGKDAGIMKIQSHYNRTTSTSGGGTGGGRGRSPPNNFGEEVAPLQRIFGCSRSYTCLYTACGRCRSLCAIRHRLVVMQLHVLYLASCQVVWSTASASTMSCNITVTCSCCSSLLSRWPMANTTY